MNTETEIIIEELSTDINHIAYCRLLLQLTSIDPDSISKEAFAANLKEIQSNPYHKILIAKKGELLVGTITILIEPKIIHNLSRVAHIEDVIVDETVRGLGIGRLLVNRALDVGRLYGCYKVILDCSPRCMAFYSKMGFEHKGEQMALYY